MRRSFVSALTAVSIAASAAPLLIASNTSAVAQLLDPGWQLVQGRPSYGGDGGLIGSMFADGAVPPLMPRVYQPAPTYYQQPAAAYYMPAPQQRAYQLAPVYYRQALAPQPRTYQPAPVYYQQALAPQPRVSQPAPVYYLQAPAPQQRVSQSAPVYYQQVSAPQPRASQPAPVYYQQVSAPQQRAYQAGPAASASITGSVPTPPQQVVAQLPAQSDQPAPAPRRSFFQLTPPPQSAVQQAPQYDPPAPAPQPQRSIFQLIPLPPPLPQVTAYGDAGPGYAPSSSGDLAHPIVDPKYERQVVDYRTDEPPGTIVIDTPHYFLYLVMEGGKAMRYGIGVGRPGYTWAGVKEVSAMREWPEWRPPPDMLERRPDLPRFMPGGPDNPLGARALYLGSTLYRIHGSNEPWTIGTQVSSGCIRLRNADVTDLYGRVKVGTKVVVI
jgi:lipoprotein-anchoring transpeptidase ErfK/SrfK